LTKSGSRFSIALRFVSSGVRVMARIDFSCSRKRI
jgi:hypothetical protein